MLEDDLLTCVECNRVLYLSGVTCLHQGGGGGAGALFGPVRSRAADGGRGYRDEGAAAGVEAEDEAISPPPSACLLHAKALKKLVEANEANGSKLQPRLLQCLHRPQACILQRNDMHH